MHARRRRRFAPWLLALAAGCGGTAKWSGGDGGPGAHDLAGAVGSEGGPTIGDSGVDLGGDLTPAPDLAGCAGTTSSCGLGADCVDCTMSALGTACIPVDGGAPTCGCAAPGDCPVGKSCNLATRACETACGDGHGACHGGCCDGKQCIAGTENASCGSDGLACVPCGGGTPTCVAGTCSSTCAVGGTGGASCGTGFCCNATNQCARVSDTACGLAGAACVDCTHSAAGPRCVVGASGATCGCFAAADCPAGEACLNGACGSACDGAHPCNGGCCDGASDTCATGDANGACALGQPLCATCAGSPMGAACLPTASGRTCGCTSAADCPAGTACNLSTRACETACGDMHHTLCSGGCCQSGACTDGLSATACGSGGGACVSCTANAALTGSACVPAGSGGACGCNQLSDCPAGAIACNANHACVISCSIASPCRSGCCSIPSGATTGTCLPGTDNAACGLDGNICFDCSRAARGHVCTPAQTCGCNTTADCPLLTACDTSMQICTLSCSASFSCNGGCCSVPGGMVTGSCDAGGSSNACGAPGGACVDCTANPVGSRCVSGTCGCTIANDCPAGTACNLTTNRCENVCGDGNHSPCNGGCCAGGACQPGTSNAACGSGGPCFPCSGATPTCTNFSCTAACGMVGSGVCGAGTCCSMNLCVAGTADTACGYSGACVDCTGAMAGDRCETAAASGPWVCGCNAAQDCPFGLACDVTMHSCTTTCGVPGVTTVCNGGCCRIMGASGTCAPGSAANACGSGPTCTDCTATCKPGAGCVAGGCGCASDADCSASSCTAFTKCDAASANCCVPAGGPCFAASWCCPGLVCVNQTCR